MTNQIEVPLCWMVYPLINDGSSQSIAISVLVVVSREESKIWKLERECKNLSFINDNNR